MAAAALFHPDFTASPFWWEAWRTYQFPLRDHSSLRASRASPTTEANSPIAHRFLVILNGVKLAGRVRGDEAVLDRPPRPLFR
jgi:hypothetical protein